MTEQNLPPTTAAERRRLLDGLQACGPHNTLIDTTTLCRLCADIDRLTSDMAAMQARVLSLAQDRDRVTAERDALQARLKAERLTWEYPVHVVPEVKADGSPCYEAYYPDLLGCRAQGDTPEEAKAALAAAKRQYLEILLGQGDEPPKPSTYSAVTWLSFGPPTAKATQLDKMVGERNTTRPSQRKKDSLLPEQSLTPRQVVDGLVEMCAKAQRTTADLAVTGNDEQALVGARCAAALEAALIAYHREHLRRWLEERGVSAEPSAHGLCLRIHTASLATWDTLATADVFRCYKTAAEAYDAAAEALGYPGLETDPEEGPAP